MLFLVGLELEPKRLWALRKPIFGWGQRAALRLGCADGADRPGAGALMGLSPGWRLALVAALGLAMSSTAIGLGALAERNLMGTTSGQSVLSVMLLQDVASIPILALFPLLAITGAAHADGGWWMPPRQWA